MSLFGGSNLVGILSVWRYNSVKEEAFHTNLKASQEYIQELRTSVSSFPKSNETWNKVREDMLRFLANAQELTLVCKATYETRGGASFLGRFFSHLAGNSKKCDQLALELHQN